jgi:simple sugar transport system ATP-binding protein
VVFELHKHAARPRGVLLEVHDLHALNERGLPALRGVTFSIARGEILGIAGVDGNGQAELAEVITGLRRARSGHVRLAGRDVTDLSPRARIAMGIGYIPADRQRFGAILDFSVADNMVVKTFHRPPFCHGIVLNQSAIDAHARKLAQQFDVRMTAIRQPFRALSGGNQQKVILAREVSSGPELLVAMQPTRGLDVGASEYVLRTILAERDRGAGVLYMSTELDEVLAMSDRVAVLFNGEVMGVVRPKEVPLEKVSLMMAGGLRLPLPPGPTA